MSEISNASLAKESLFKFIPNETFIAFRDHDDGTRTVLAEYVQDAVYTVREGNEYLAGRVSEWKEQGKVNVYPAGV